MRDILVAGDMMIDRYTYVQTSRRAQEADVPVWDVKFEDARLGGAANVANNIKSIGGDDVRVWMLGITPDGDFRYLFTDFPMALQVPGCPMIKRRYVSYDGFVGNTDGADILFRCDNFQRFDPEDVKRVVRASEWASRVHFDALVVSDYDKGTITEEIIKNLEHIPLRLVDSKRKDLSIFKGFDVLKINSNEFDAQNGMPYILEELFGCCVVTLGDKGAMIRVHESQANRSDDVPGHLLKGKYKLTTDVVPAIPVENVVDITGCGDTHTAAMTLAMLNGKDVWEATKFANECASRVVGSLGTSVA